MKAKTREVGMNERARTASAQLSRNRRRWALRKQNQLEERARKARPRLEHPGRSGAQPQTGSSGGGTPAPQTGTSVAGPRNWGAAPWT